MSVWNWKYSRVNNTSFLLYRVSSKKCDKLQEQLPWVKIKRFRSNYLISIISFPQKVMRFQKKIVLFHFFKITPKDQPKSGFWQTVFFLFKYLTPRKQINFLGEGYLGKKWFVKNHPLGDPSDTKRYGGNKETYRAVTTSAFFWRKLNKTIYIIPVTNKYFPAISWVN